jgi:hypothetical protein
MRVFSPTRHASDDRGREWGDQAVIRGWRGMGTAAKKAQETQRGSKAAGRLRGRRLIRRLWRTGWCTQPSRSAACAVAGSYGAQDGGQASRPDMMVHKSAMRQHQQQVRGHFRHGDRGRMPVPYIHPSTTYLSNFIRIVLNASSLPSPFDHRSTSSISTTFSCATKAACSRHCRSLSW